MKRIVLLAFASLFLLSTCLHLEIPVSAQVVNNPYELVVATIGEPETVDPAGADDTASQELIFNVYETLISYDRESVDEFVPMLATDWWISSDGLTYTFKIREGVMFHNGETLTTEDVEYSFERTMVMDHGGGLQWMIYEPLLNVSRANISDPDFGAKIDSTVESNATHVWFNLAEPFAPFLQILCHPCFSVINKEWAVTQGCWDGDWEHWLNYHDPIVPGPLMDPEPVMMGTGPYIFDYWEYRLEWSVVKFDDYWAGWPAQHPVLGIQARGYVERATVQFIDEWATRKTMFLDGDVDIAYVPRMYMNEVLGQPGIRCVYPRPILICSSAFFNYNISLSSRYLKPPFTSYECTYGELNENGLPPDFFSDVNVRKGFAYSINYTEFLQAAYDGEALYPGTPAIMGLPYRNPEQEKYEFNLTEAEEHFRKAWNGQLWTKGFNLTILYNTGNLPRETICKMLETNIESLNPRFHIRVYRIPWGSDPNLELFRGELTLFIIGWLADYPDPHNLFHPFMHTTGAFADWQSYSNPIVDALIEEGGTCVDSMRRQEIYYELQKIYFDDCPSVAIYQTLNRHWEREWVQGWYYNPAHPSLYFYHLWKEDLPPEDLNLDGRVNIRDVFVAAEAFGSYCALLDVHPRWDAYADINLDERVDIRDITFVAMQFGYTASPWTPP